MPMSLELNQRPAILVYISDTSYEHEIKEVLNGIEEEGVPYLLLVKTTLEIIKLTHEGANMSSLSVGVGCDGKKIVVHYRNLPTASPLFVVERYQLKSKEVLRHLGVNAARLVKGIAFKDVEETGVRN